MYLVLQLRFILSDTAEMRQVSGLTVAIWFLLTWAALRLVRAVREEPEDGLCFDLHRVFCGTRYRVCDRKTLVPTARWTQLACTLSSPATPATPATPVDSKAVTPGFGLCLVASHEQFLPTPGQSLSQTLREQK